MSTIIYLLVRFIFPPSLPSCYFPAYLRSWASPRCVFRPPHFLDVGSGSCPLRLRQQRSYAARVRVRLLLSALEILVSCAFSFACCAVRGCQARTLASGGDRIRAVAPINYSTSRVVLLSLFFPCRVSSLILIPVILQRLPITGGIRSAFERDIHATRCLAPRSGSRVARASVRTRRVYARATTTLGPRAAGRAALGQGRRACSAPPCDVLRPVRRDELLELWDREPDPELEGCLGHNVSVHCVRRPGFMLLTLIRPTSVYT